MVNESDVSGNAVQHTPCQDTWNIVITCSQQCRHLKKAAASSFIIFKCVSWAQQHSSVPLTTTTTPTKLCVVMGCCWVSRSRRNGDKWNHFILSCLFQVVLTAGRLLQFYESACRDYCSMVDAWARWNPKHLVSACLYAMMFARN